MQPITVFYVRLSASKKKDKDKKLTTKERDDQEYHSQVNALREKWKVEPDHVVREKKSGASSFKLLKELTKTLPIGSTIYAVRIDRITREGPFALGYIATTAKERDIKIITLKDGDVTVLKQQDQVMAMFEAYAAAQEHSFIVSRIHEYIESCNRDGIPWGIHKAKANGNFRPKHKEVSPLWKESLPRIIELREQKYTIREIADIASREFKQRFTKERIHRLLTEGKLANKKKKAYKPRARSA